MRDIETHGLAAMPPRSTAGRYTATAQALHWLTVPLLLAILAVAWVMIALPKGPDKAWWFVVHRSLGVTILAVVAARLLWRGLHPAPPLPGGTPRAIEVLGRLTHWLLYALLILMPVTGYLQSASGRPVSYFGLFDLPALPENQGLDALCKSLHLIGQWGIYGLAGLHVLATAWHMAMRRDSLLDRMMPPQDGAGPLSRQSEA